MFVLETGSSEHAWSLVTTLIIQQKTHAWHTTLPHAGAVLNILLTKWKKLECLKLKTDLHIFAPFCSYYCTDSANEKNKKYREKSPLSPHAGGQHSWQWIMGVSWYRTIASVITHTITCCMINLYTDSQRPWMRFWGPKIAAASCTHLGPAYVMKVIIIDV